MRTEPYPPNLLSRPRIHGGDSLQPGAGMERSGVPTAQVEQRTVLGAEDLLGSADAVAPIVCL